MPDSSGAREKLTINMEGLGDDARRRLKDAAEQAGLELREPAKGQKVTPASQGEIETSFELPLAGLDEDAIQRLRDKVYSSDRHSNILDSILNSALDAYGGDPIMKGVFVQWVWCQWLQYAAMEESGFAERETFKKRFRISPSIQAIQGEAGGHDWAD